MTFFFLELLFHFYLLSIGFDFVTPNESSYRNAESDKCITFTRTSSPSKNKCFRRIIPTISWNFTELVCTIHDMSQMNVSECHRPTSMISLFLREPSLFESYFNRLDNTIRSLFHQNQEETFVLISLDKFNATRISWNYINGSLYPLLKYAKNLRLDFPSGHLSTSESIFENDFSGASIDLQISIECPGLKGQPRTFFLMNGTLTGVNDAPCKSSI